MKALQVTGPKRMHLVNIQSPKLSPGQVRIKVHQVGVCGTDISLIAGKLPFARYPIVPGHEFAGVVIETTTTSSFKIGDRVTANPVMSCGKCAECKKGNINHCSETAVLGVVKRNGAFAEEVVVDEGMLFHLPEELSFEQGAMVEPVAVAVRITERGNIKKGDTVAILGSGSIGLLTLLVARSKGASDFMVTDVLDYRLDMARELGAEIVVNSSKADVVETGFKHFDGFNTVIDGVATGETLRQSIKLCKAGGTVVIYGVPEGGEIALAVKDAFVKDLLLITSRLYPRSFDKAISLLQNRQIDVEPIITDRVSLDQAEKAITDLMERRSKTIKLLIHPKGE